MTTPRLLVIMGSGETAPTMRGPHRQVFERLGDDVRAVLLDTPFGFQENAAILADKTAEYFRDAVGRTVEIAGLPRADTGDVMAVESAVARLRAADWVFAGPGSPTFALAQWRRTPIPDVLAEKLRSGGAVVFSSAAALTLGVATVPVYEVYKVGTDPYWEEGLDLLSTVGIRAAVIPHFDNREGGNHDTRFCYLGERRLTMIEPELPDGAFVLGVDEHTALVVDLDAGTADVLGKGGVTLRRPGRSVRVEAGETVPIEVLRSGGDALVAGDPDGEPDRRAGGDADAAVAGRTPTAETREPGGEAAATDVEPASLAADTARLEGDFETAIEAGDADAAVTAILELDRAILDWSRDTLQSDQVDRARVALRSMIVRLGEAATEGLRDRREVVGPVVEAALAARVTARREKAYAVADAIRDELTAAGVEVRDTPDGTEWLLAAPG